jgi:hypothetical protein
LLRNFELVKLTLLSAVIACRRKKAENLTYPSDRGFAKMLAGSVTLSSSRLDLVACARLIWAQIRIQGCQVDTTLGVSSDFDPASA